MSNGKTAEEVDWSKTPETPEGFPQVIRRDIHLKQPEFSPSPGPVSPPQETENGSEPVAPPATQQPELSPGPGPVSPPQETENGSEPVAPPATQQPEFSPSPGSQIEYQPEYIYYDDSEYDTGLATYREPTDNTVLWIGLGVLGASIAGMLWLSSVEDNKGKK